MVKALAASGKKKTSETAGSCTEVNTIAVQLTTLVNNFPGSPQVLVYSATIIASSTVVCTEDEKASLGELDAMFEEAVATLDTAVEAAQEQLETLTGSTASPEEIAVLATVADGETTTAAGGAGLYIFSLYCNAPRHLMIFHLTMRNELTRSDFDDSKSDKKPKRKEGVKVRLLR